MATEWFLSLSNSRRIKISSSVERIKFDLSEMYTKSETKYFHKCPAMIIQKIINFVWYILKIETRKEFTFGHLAWNTL